MCSAAPLMRQLSVEEHEECFDMDMDMDDDEDEDCLIEELEEL